MHRGEESMEKSSLKLILSRLGRLEPLWTLLKCGDDDFLMISTVWWAGGGEDKRGQLWIVIIMTIIALTAPTAWDDDEGGESAERNYCWVSETGDIMQ